MKRMRERNMESDMWKRERDRNIEIERMKQEICKVEKERDVMNVGFKILFLFLVKKQFVLKKVFIFFINLGLYLYN